MRTLEANPNLMKLIIPHEYPMHLLSQEPPESKIKTVYESEGRADPRFPRTSFS
jgi:hypothetical protein